MAFYDGLHFGVACNDEARQRYGQPDGSLGDLAIEKKRMRSLESVEAVNFRRSPNVGGFLTGVQRDWRPLFGTIGGSNIKQGSHSVGSSQLSAKYVGKSRMQALYRVSCHSKHLLNPVQSVCKDRLRNEQNNALRLAKLFTTLCWRSNPANRTAELNSGADFKLPPTAASGFPVQAFWHAEKNRAQWNSIANKAGESGIVYFDNRLLPNIDNLDKVLLPLVGIDRRIKHVKEMPEFYVNPLSMPLQDLQYHALRPLRPMPIAYVLGKSRWDKAANLLEYFCTDIVANLRKQLAVQREVARKRRCLLNAYKEKSGRITTIPKRDTILGQAKSSKTLELTQSSVFEAKSRVVNNKPQHQVEAYSQTDTEVTLDFLKNVRRVLQQNIVV